MTTFVPNWMGNLSLVNVKDYGAKGDGSTDDTAAIQAAFDAAFGTSGTQTNFRCIPVYFPPGNYITMAPLYIVGVIGAYIFGAGNGTSQIYFQGNPNHGNTLTQPAGGDASLNPLTPIIAIDGMGYSRVERLTIHTDFVNAENPNMIGIMIYQSNFHGYCGQNLFSDMTVENCYCGIFGNQGGGNCDNCTFVNILFNTCARYGINAFGQNVINWQVLGGGAASCAWLSTYNAVTGSGTTPGAAYFCQTGSIGLISCVSCSGNNWDIINRGGQQMHVVGGSFEGAHHYTISSLSWSSGTATLVTSAPHQMQGTVPIQVFDSNNTNFNGIFTGTVTNTTTITYPLASPGSATAPLGKLVRDNVGSIASDGTTVCVSGCAYRTELSASGCFLAAVGGLITCDGSFVSPNNADGIGKIVQLNNGIIFMRGCTFNSQLLSTSTVKGTGVSQLFIEGSSYGATPSSAFYSGFTSGLFKRFDFVENTTVAALPTPSAIFAGCRGSVTDLNIARAFGGSVLTHGGGSTVCPVIGTATDWIMG